MRRDLPPTLPTGTGHFVVTLGAGVVYPPVMTRIGNVNINAQILEPDGGAHDFEYRKYSFNADTEIGTLSDLEQLRQVIVKTPIYSNSTPIPVAAAEYDLLVPVLDQSFSDVSSSVPNSDIAIILDNQTNYDRNQTSLNWSRSGDSIKVVITSLSGNQDANLIRFSTLIANYANAEANGWSIADTASLVTVKYYDLNGNEISGPTPYLAIR